MKKILIYLYWFTFTVMVASAAAVLFMTVFERETTLDGMYVVMSSATIIHGIIYAWCHKLKVKIL